MSVTIQLKRDSSPNQEPPVLENGEIALNTADGVLFYGDGSTLVKTLLAAMTVSSGPPGVVKKETALHFNTTDNVLYVSTGTSWRDVGIPTTGGAATHPFNISGFGQGGVSIEYLSTQEVLDNNQGAGVKIWALSVVRSIRGESITVSQNATVEGKLYIAGANPSNTGEAELFVDGAIRVKGQAGAGTSGIQHEGQGGYIHHKKNANDGGAIVVQFRNTLPRANSEGVDGDIDFGI